MRYCATPHGYKQKTKQNKKRCHFELRPTGALSLDLSADSQIIALLAFKSSKALTNQILVSRFHNLTPLGKVVKEMHILTSTV